eukprot:GHVN01079456.1.p1 GENE.GHVN01079456.1~~GHVN01079456.1.p1  ORF type:complete len:284 (+),score=21.78 GHVN01079456.1:238-1089(+)
MPETKTIDEQSRDDSTWDTVGIKKGSKLFHISVYELYVLEVFGRPTDQYEVPWIVWANVGGTFGFTLGSILFLDEDIHVPALWVFAIASLLDAVACAGMMWKAFKRGKPVIVAADFLLTISCIIFAITSVPPLWWTHRIPVIWTWVASSAMFLVGCAMMQGVLIVCLGGWGAFITVPLEILNTLGSVFYLLGSILLFWQPMRHLGTWNYIIGSAIFFLTSLASIIVARMRPPSKQTVKLISSTTASFCKEYDVERLSSQRSAGVSSSQASSAAQNRAKRSVGT